MFPSNTYLDGTTIKLNKYVDRSIYIFVNQR